jgi:leucine-rich repeat transmembrane neuronal protein 1/2
VEFTADSLRLDILELARTGNKLLSMAGRPDWMCQAVEVADPITFTTPDTVLVSHHCVSLICFSVLFFFISGRGRHLFIPFIIFVNSRVTPTRESLHNKAACTRPL